MSNKKKIPKLLKKHVNKYELKLKSLDQKHLIPVWKELKEKYGVEKIGDSIKAYDGTIYHKKYWLPFEAVFHYQALNEKIALEAIKLYKKYLQPLVVNDKYLEFQLESWLWTNYRFIISDTIDPFVLLAGNYKFKTYIDKAPFKDGLRKFIDGLQKIYSVNHYKRNPKIKKVMIITSTGMGGGHVGVAKALKGELEKNGLEVAYVDTRLLNVDQDVMMKLTGEFHSEDVLLKIMHAEGDREKADNYWEIRGGLLPYITDNSLAFLQQKVIEEKPDLIFSSIHHRHELLTVTLGMKIPIYVVSTDYKLQTTIPTFIYKANPDYLKILTTTTDPSFFVDLVKWDWEEKKWEQASSFYENSALFLEGKISWSDFKSRVKVFDLFGFPVREQFEPYEKDRIRQVKKKLGIPLNSKVLMISMGYHASNDVKDYVEEIIAFDDRLSENVHVIVSAGRNEDLEKTLQKLTSREFKHLSFSLIGFLSAEGMADHYNVSNLLFSKPGGGTTAEISIVGLPLISKKTYEWELDNLNFLIKHNLGYLVDDTKELVPEVIKKLSELPLEPEKKPLERIDWIKNLKSILDL